VEIDHLGHHRRGPGGDLDHVGGDTCDVGAEWLAVPDGVGDLRAAHQCLGGNAGNVDAGAADHADLDQGHLLAGLCLIHGKRLAGFAAAEDNDAITFRFGHVRP
jgi:hypothetical protein